MAAPKLEQAVVASGHTVHVGESGTEAWNHELREYAKIVRPARAVGPGETVELPSEEVARLRRLGFLVDPAKIAPETGPGPKFEAGEGPRIAAA